MSNDVSKPNKEDIIKSLIQQLTDPNLDINSVRESVNKVLEEYTLQNKVILTLMVRYRLMSIEKMLTLIDNVENELINNPNRISKFTSTKDLVKLYGEINRNLSILLSLVQEIDKDDLKGMIVNINTHTIKDNVPSDIEELRRMVMEIKHKLNL
jgi:hypothetical protein